CGTEPHARDPVRRRTAHPTPIPFDLGDRAAATVLRIRAGEAARARVHGGDPLEARWEGHHSPGAGDQDATLLERQAERLEDVAVELGELVEEKDAVMRAR